MIGKSIGDPCCFEIIENPPMFNALIRIKIKTNSFVKNAAAQILPEKLIENNKLLTHKLLRFLGDLKRGKSSDITEGREAKEEDGRAQYEDSQELTTPPESKTLDSKKPNERARMESEDISSRTNQPAKKSFSEKIAEAPDADVDWNLLAKKERLEKKLNKLEQSIGYANKNDMPGTYVTGRSNVPRSRIKKLNRQIDRRIDLATEYTKTKQELYFVNNKIKYQKDGFRREIINKKVKSRLEKQFDTIEVGDFIDIGGNTPIEVLKKNRKTVVTKNGVKWKAEEISRVIKKDQLKDNLKKRKKKASYSIKPGGSDLKELNQGLKFYRDVFPKQKVSRESDGSIVVKTKSGESLKIKNVRYISIKEAAFEVGYSRKTASDDIAVGKYYNGTIELHSIMGNRWILRHESVHWMEDVGLINERDVRLLKNRIKSLHKRGKSGGITKNRKPWWKRP